MNVGRYNQSGHKQDSEDVHLYDYRAGPGVSAASGVCFGTLLPVPRSLLVVAGVIERDGLVLVCQRQAGDTHAFKWEFPGGKVEPGETPQQALMRELNEELGITAEVGEEIARYEYRYARRPPIMLIFYRVRAFEGEPKPLVFEAIRWEPHSRLPAYDFLDGDREFIRRLSRPRR